jgi:dodecin
VADGWAGLTHRALVLAEEKNIMSVAKVVEITAESPQSFEAAIKHGIERANQTLKNLQTAWVKEQTVVIREGRPVAYRVDLKVTFLLQD